MIPAILALLSQSAQDPPIWRPIQLVKTIIGTPTGRNGYEEYLMAAEAMHNPKFEDAYRNLTSSGPGQDTWLASRVAVAAQSGSARQLVLEGNRKEVFDPRSFTQDTLFPDLVYLKMVARYLPIQATVEFSQGQNKRGAETLLGGLVFSGKLSGTGVLLSFLVSMATNSIILAGYSENLERIPLSSWDSVVNYCNEALSLNPLKRSILLELDGVPGNVDYVFINPREWGGVFGDLDDQTADMVDRIKSLSATQRQAVKARVLERVAAYRRVFIQAMDQDESKWVLSTSALENVAQREEPDPLVQWILDSSLAVYSQAYPSELKRRAQLRILRLHGLIQSHRWRTGVLPGSLKDLDNDPACADPLSGSWFCYEPTEDGYQLYSKGGSGMTRVDLGFKRPVSSDSGDEPSPPARPQAR